MDCSDQGAEAISSWLATEFTVSRSVWFNGGAPGNLPGFSVAILGDTFYQNEFKGGEDYFRITGRELSEFANTFSVYANASKIRALILLIESGYLLA